MAPVGPCRPLPTVHENSEEIKEDGCSQSVSVVQSGWLRLENAPKCQPDSEEVCQSRCNVFCASIINIAVSSELGYGLRRRKKCRYSEAYRENSVSTKRGQSVLEKKKKDEKNACLKMLLLAGAANWSRKKRYKTGAVVLVASKRVLLRLGRASKAVTLLLHPRLWSADTKGIRHLRIYGNRNEHGQAKTNGTRSEGETSKTRCESRVACIGHDEINR
nr:PREDICTED: uncharacterized protein LOC100883680 isoform X1 [Megachile rotundata]XP_012152611.1 PREDICTED: uncharacterized protein LOC100883680 isoform X1 [Megachile rotundata]XP_012152612.1 PREDICTED: uncharacterized protein LOC100883680 isoform X1 [Megachile rotundata]XP_012152613.1 PREDICTED: uncharacterized protein LOC100883680 isoform X1 [Megachile rotundata]XP_012152614.1 PREDICTED: uncharacterized protein LOC100883680 isoform X1 [Megachile rotundata]